MTNPVRAAEDREDADALRGDVEGERQRLGFRVGGLILAFRGVKNLRFFGRFRVRLGIIFDTQASVFRALRRDTRISSSTTVRRVRGAVLLVSVLRHDPAPSCRGRLPARVAHLADGLLYPFEPEVGVAVPLLDAVGPRLYGFEDDLLAFLRVLARRHLRRRFSLAAVVSGFGRYPRQGFKQGFDLRGERLARMRLDPLLRVPLPGFGRARALYGVVGVGLEVVNEDRGLADRRPVGPRADDVAALDDGEKLEAGLALPPQKVVNPAAHALADGLSVALELELRAEG